MARPIRETPILFGEDARRFEKRMKRVIFEAKNRGLSNVQLKVETKANKLLYLVWKHPNKITIGIARAAMNVFDRR